MYNNCYSPNFFDKGKYFRPNCPNYPKKTFQNLQNSHQPKCDVSSNSSLNDKAYQQSNSLFEIFGIKIYFDDLLIVCILLFLYQEGIKDEYLFIALILLLLS